MAHSDKEPRQQVHLSKTLFCDDSSYSVSKLADAREVLERIGWFSAATGMELNILKTFYVVMNMPEAERADLNEQPLAIPMPEFDAARFECEGTWQYRRPIEYAPIKEETPDYEWRHLGNFQSNHAHSDLLKEGLHEVVENGVEYMASKRLAQDGALMGYKLKFLPQMLFRTKHGNLTRADLNNLQIKVNSRMKHKLRIPQTTANAILFGHEVAGGIHFPHLWDETNIEKVKILQASLQEPQEDIYQVIVGAARRLQEWSCLPHTPLSYRCNYLLSMNDDLWISSVWRWMSEHNITIQMPSITISPPHHGDFPLLERYIDHRTSKLAAEDRTVLAALQDGHEVDPTVALKELQRQVEDLRMHLCANEIMWASDISTQRITKFNAARLNTCNPRNILKITDKCRRRPAADYMRARCIAVHGKTVAAVLAAKLQYTNNRGQLCVYKETDIKYDVLKVGLLTSETDPGEEETANQDHNQRSGKSNRVLRGKLHYLHNHNRKYKWVFDHFGGLPGVLKPNMDCDFSLGISNSDAHETMSPFDTFVQDHSEQLAGLEYTEENLQEYVQSHTPADTAQCFTDGSVWQKTGTFAYMLFDKGSIEASDMNSKIYGGGQEDFSYQVEQCVSSIYASKLSSTRMEALALLALHITVHYMDPDHTLNYTNGCDSKAAINTYRKLMVLNRMQLPNLPNSDVWQIIKWYRTNWGNINMYHVPSHMDEYVEQMDHLLPEWKGNIMADALADEYYSEDTAPVPSLEAAKLVPGQLVHGIIPITIPFSKWARNFVSMKRIQRYFQSHHPAALDGVQIDWGSMHQSTKRLKHVWQRVRMAKLIWNMYAFQFVKMTRGHVKPSEIACTYCGKHTETQQHVFKDCTADEILNVKKHLFGRICDYLSEHVEKEASIWLKQNVSNIWNNEKVKFPETHLGNELKDLDIETITKCAWTGVTPVALVDMIKIVLTKKHKGKAARIAGHIHSFTSDALMEIWQIRTDKLKLSTPIAKQVSKYQTADEKAKILISQGLLPGHGGQGLMTEKEYMRLHKTHRFNKVQKYLHNLHADGKPPNVIPRIGQHVRSYRLNESTSTCETQQGMIQSYTGDPRTPYRVFSLGRLS